MRFDYTAFDSDGKSVGGMVEAADVTDAMDQLCRQGLYVSQVRALKEDAAPGPSWEASARTSLRWGQRSCCSRPRAW